jgi:hypothetical protein
VNNTYEHLASLLDVSSNVIEDLERELSGVFRQKPLFHEVSQEIEKSVEQFLIACGLSAV